MTWCKAFYPTDESPPWRPDPHASSRRAHAQTQAAPGRSAFSARTITPAPPRTRPGHHVACSDERTCPVHARTRPRHPCARSPSPVTNEPTDPPRPIEPNRPITRKRTNDFPAAHVRTRAARTLPPSLRSGSLPVRPLFHHPRFCSKTVIIPSTPFSPAPSIHGAPQRFTSYRAAPAMTPAPILRPRARANPSHASARHRPQPTIAARARPNPAGHPLPGATLHGNQC